MGFRTVIIKNRSKLDLKMNYLICRGEDTTSIFIPEISMLILESTAISLTCALISELIKNNVKIIFCDEKHNPESELLAYHNSYNSAKRIRQQIQWDEKVQHAVWSKIIENKILNQAKLLREQNLIKEEEMLMKYSTEIVENDLTNREGHAAKVYFNALFGLDFGRRNEHIINGALNYGYAILLSCFNREITRMGYLTQIGIWHKNEYNAFNLSCDLIEPFRVLIDRIVVNMDKNKEIKSQILNIFNIKIKIDNKLQYLENAISIYCQSIIEALNNKNPNLIKFYEL